MVKQGKTLYAGKCDGTWYVKQAKSPAQFTRLCIASEKAKGYTVPRRGRWLYTPDLFWDGADRIWRNMDGTAYVPKLPHGAREKTA